MTNKKIIILAHDRSGSTNLSKILSCHPKINIIIEPFNRTLQVKIKSNLINKLDRIKDIESLNNFLNYIHRTYNGFKTLFGILTPELREYLFLKKDYKIIILTRKNLLKSAISSLIAQKIDIWGVTKNHTLQKIREKILREINKPFPIKKIKEMIEKRKRASRHYKDLFKKNNYPFYELYYEDLFDPEIPLNKKIEKIQEIIEFLGYKKITDRRVLEEMKSLLDFNKTKINNRQTYNSIPNLSEIQRELGNDKTGYLLEDKLNILRAKLESIKKHSLISSL